MSHIRVLCLEPRALMRDLLVAALSGRVEVVDSIASLDQLAAALEAHKPDVLILGTAGDDALGAARILADAGASTRILVVASSRTISIQRAVDAGIAGVVMLDQSIAALVSAVERVHAGQRVLPEVRTAQSMRLSPREFETLRFLAAGMTNREIAARLGISVKTIDTPRGHVLKKLKLRNNADLTRYAIEHGLHEPDIAREPRRDDAAAMSSSSPAPMR